MLVLLLLLTGVVALQTGCYYGHLAVGQTRLLCARRPVDAVIADPTTAPELRERLLLVERARAFARELGLEVDGQYTSYVDATGDRVLTSLVVTEPGRIDARAFSFPIVGDAPYKGFFEQARAEAEAEHFTERGYDTCLFPVSAYSTLGWFDDPLTAPMLRAADGRLVETVVHELVHATVFLRSQPELNEGVAQFIGEEASVRFFAGDAEAVARRRDEVADDRQVAAVLSSLRANIAALYALQPDPAAHAEQRLALESAARAELAALPLATRDAAALAARARLGDACLALRGAYQEDGPRHAALLAALDGDLSRFVARLREVAASAERDGRDVRTAFFAYEPAPIATEAKAAHTP